jgi:hypothetical protein
MRLLPQNHLPHGHTHRRLGYTRLGTISQAGIMGAGVDQHVSWAGIMGAGVKCGHENGYWGANDRMPFILLLQFSEINDWYTSHISIFRVKQDPCT